MLARLTIAVLASATLLLGAGAVGRLVGRAADGDTAALTAEDRFVTLAGGRAIRYQRHGAGAAAPTFLLLHGLGGTLDDWRHVMQRLAADAPVVAYDRGGAGFSAPVAGPRDAAALADELHEVLAAVDAPRPYVLVAHSIAGLTARVFADRYRDDTAGLVLVDPLLPDEWERVSPASVSADHEVFFEGLPEQERLARTGWPTVKAWVRDALGRGPAGEAARRHDMATRKPSHWAAAHTEAKAVFDGYAAVRLADAADDIRKLPLGVLSAGSPDSADRRIVNALHAAFAKRSDASLHVILPPADHVSLIADEAHARELARFATKLRDLAIESGTTTVAH